MKKFLAVCRTVLHWLGRLETGFLCLLLAAMILLSSLQIVLRLMNGGFIWADPLLRYLVLWSGLLGGAVATRQAKHIRIDLASHLLPPPLQVWLQVLLDLLSGLVCVVLTRVSIVFVRNEASFGSDSVLFAIPGWILYLVFPIAFGIMSWRFFVAAINNFRGALRSAMPPPTAP